MNEMNLKMFSFCVIDPNSVMLTFIDYSTFVIFNKCHVVMLMSNEIFRKSDLFIASVDSAHTKKHEKIKNCANDRSRRLLNGWPSRVAPFPSNKSISGKEQRKRGCVCVCVFRYALVGRSVHWSTAIGRFDNWPKNRSNDRIDEWPQIGKSESN